MWAGMNFYISLSSGNLFFLDLAYIKISPPPLATNHLPPRSHSSLEWQCPTLFHIGSFPCRCKNGRWREVEVLSYVGDEGSIFLLKRELITNRLRRIWATRVLWWTLLLFSSTMENPGVNLLFFVDPMNEVWKDSAPLFSYNPTRGPKQGSRCIYSM